MPTSVPLNGWSEFTDNKTGCDALHNHFHHRRRHHHHHHHHHHHQDSVVQCTSLYLTKNCVLDNEKHFLKPHHGVWNMFLGKMFFWFNS